MKITLKYGIDKLLFGMKQTDVISIYGKPNKQYKDEDNNLIFVYNIQKMCLTFYEDENFRLGYIVSSNTDLELFEKKIIGKNSEEMNSILSQNKIIKLQFEDFDTFENYFDEENWITFQAEFDQVTKIEIGATFTNNDEFDWKFGNS